MKLIITFIVIVLPIIGCAPIILSDTPDGVTLRYDPVLQSRSDIDKNAQKLCQRYGKRAFLIRENNTSPIGIGHAIDNYECR